MVEPLRVILGGGADDLGEAGGAALAAAVRDLRIPRLTSGA